MRGGRGLTATQLERLGRRPIARQVEHARAAGVDAYGWLPTSQGPAAVADYARDQAARAVVVAADGHRRRRRRQRRAPLRRGALLVGLSAGQDQARATR